MQGLGIITPTHSLNPGIQVSWDWRKREGGMKRRGGKGRYQKCALSDHVSVIDPKRDIFGQVASQSLIWLMWFRTFDGISNSDLACGMSFDLDLWNLGLGRSFDLWSDSFDSFDIDSYLMWFRSRPSFFKLRQTHISGPYNLLHSWQGVGAGIDGVKMYVADEVWVQEWFTVYGSH